VGRPNEPAFMISEQAIASAVSPLVRCGLLEETADHSAPADDPARWDKLAIACTEFLNGGIHDVSRPAEFDERLKVLALKLTAEAAIAWRAATHEVNEPCALVTK
jgi:hypothetical protein